MTCPDCQKPLPPNAPGGVCPRCVAAGFYGDEEAEPITLDEPLREAGEKIGRYRLIEPLGEGGFGIVYRAEQMEPFQRQVALKLIKPGLDSRMVLARFDAERQALSMLDHANIARVLDAGTTEDGRPFFVMELVPGRPVTEHCERARLTLEERLRLFLQICAGVEHAHAKGVIHRDLKPTNVLVIPPQGEVGARAVIIDFGIAKAMWQELTPHTLYTSPQQMLGTPDYMSPEQAQNGGLDIDTRADVYSLGAVLYEMLTGHPPLRRKGLANAGLEECLRAIREAVPLRPSRELATMGAAARDLRLLTARTEAELDWVVLKALAKERDRRYQTVRELAEDVRCFLEHEPVQARPPTVAYLLGKYVRRHRAQVAAMVVTLLALMTATVVSWKMARRALSAEVSTRRSFSQADAASAHEHAEQQHVGHAVALLCRALRVDPDNQEARFRLLTLLSQGTSGILAAPVVQLSDRPRDCRFLRSGNLIMMVMESGSTVGFWRYESGEVKGLRTLTLGDRLQCHALSTDERLLAMVASVPGQAGTQVGVWSVPDGKPVTPVWGLTSGAEEVREIVFSPDGKQLHGVMEPGSVVSWEVATQRKLWEVKLPAKGRCIAVSPDGSLLAVGREDRQMTLLETGDGRQIWSEEVLRKPVKQVAFSLDGRHAMSVRGDSYITCVEVAERSFKKHYLEHHFGIDAWAQTPDMARILTGGPDGYVRVRPVGGGFISAARMMDNVTALAVAGSGPLGAAGTREPEAGFELISQRTGTPLRAHVSMDRGVTSLSFNEDVTRLLVATRSNTAHVFDVRTRALRDRKIRAPGRIRYAGFLPEETGMWALEESGMLRRWQLPDGAVWGEGLRLSDMEDGPYEVCEDGRLAVFATRSGAIRRVDLVQWRELEPLAFPAGDVLLALSPEGNRIAVAAADGSLLRVHDVVSGRLLKETRPGIAVTALAVTSHRDRVITGHDAGRLVFHSLKAEGREQRQTAREDDAVVELRVSPDEMRVVSASRSPLIHVWDAGSGEELELSRTRTPRHSDKALNTGHEVRFSHDGSEFFTFGSKDLRVRTFDSGSALASGPFLQHLNPVTLVARSPGGELLLTADTLQQLNLWHMGRRQMAATPYLLTDRIVALAFSPEGRYSLAAKGNGEIRLWPVPPVHGAPLPECFLRFAEGFGRVRLTSENILQGVPWQTFDAARREVLALPDDAANPQRAWLKWLASDPEKRSDWPE